MLLRYFTGLLFCTSFISGAMAQSPFLERGKIIYERRMNQHSQLDNESAEQEEDNMWVAEMKKNFPRFITNQYELQFGEGRTTYRITEETTPQKYLWNSRPSENDVVVQEPARGWMMVQRDVFEKTYLVQDSSRRLTWKLSDETRTIAGFQCRKATTRICDSVVVVAFYCDEIPLSSGPESMGGLPGLILGLAVPRLHTTWFAISVQRMNPGEQSLFPKLKGSKASWAKMETDLARAVSNWGKGGKLTLWKTLL